MTERGKFTNQEREQIEIVLDLINEWADWQVKHDTDLFEETETSARMAAEGLSQLLVWLRIEDEDDACKAEWIKDNEEER